MDAAIAALGGIEAFQAAVGIARRTVFLWKQNGIPAERVPEVEALSGVSRQLLRPDLWPAAAPARVLASDPLRDGRANLHALLGALLSAPADDALLARLRGLPGDETPVGRAIAALAEAAARTDAARVDREFFDLFIGVGRGELLPYASYYLTGFLHERPLAELRGDLRRLGIARAEGVPEPEDHVAFLHEVMAGLLRGEMGPGPEEADAFFGRHIRPWANRFYADLRVAEAADFFRAVGGLGLALMDVELAAAELPG
ncbi:MAG: molecular chaperone TorD family protein [Acetobacteraceae bacterium]|nr:molecular chaperone TorD family protein [Acetobacteraceae bacterium]